MSTPWRCLQTLPALLAFPSVWRFRLAQAYEQFKALCLDETDEKRISYPCPLATSCAYRITNRPDGSISGDCLRHPPTCAHIELTPADVTLLELNWHKLGRALCKALSLETRHADLNLFHTCQIGSWSTDAVPVILTIQTQPHDLLFIIGQLVARLHRKFILLTPTNDLLDANCQELLANCGAEVFPLSSTVTLTAHGTLLATRLPGELFANFRPDPKGSVSEENARQLIALVKALAAKYRFRKAPLYTVFLMFCGDGLTVAEIAHACKCHRCVIWRRLKLLQQKLGRHPAELRQYSAYFEKIEASLSDPRARRIYRRGSFNGEEEDNSDA